VADVGEHGGRVEKAAESVVLKLIARWMMAAGIPAALAAGGIIAREVVTATNNNTVALVELKALLLGNTQLLNSRLDAHADRLRGMDDRNNAQDQRMDRTDQKIDTLQLRIYQGAK